MGTAERRNDIMKILCRRRYETIRNLASEFGVSHRTISRDIEVLSLTEPIYTKSGRYDGGVYVMDGYSVNKLYVNDREGNVLKKLYRTAENQEWCVLTDVEMKVLKTMIENYIKPIIN